MEIIGYLKSFNRKERFHLIGQLLGNMEFRLDPDVLQKIVELVELNVPTQYFAAMDYHLDWIYASLELARVDGQKIRTRINNCINATQEDVDFLLAFVDKTGNTHMIMIEAKGDTAFTNQQIQNKAKRLTAIFGEHNEKWKHVIPHFLICSPIQPHQLKVANIPYFMLNKNNSDFIWFPLHMPSNQRKVTCCHENGEVSKDGAYWKVDTFRIST